MPRPKRLSMPKNRDYPVRRRTGRTLAAQRLPDPPIPGRVQSRVEMSWVNRRTRRQSYIRSNMCNLYPGGMPQVVLTTLMVAGGNNNEGQDE